MKKKDKNKKNKVQTRNMTKNINIFTSKNNQHAMKLASYFWLGVLKISEFDYPHVSSWLENKEKKWHSNPFKLPLCVLRENKHVSDLRLKASLDPYSSC